MKAVLLVRIVTQDRNVLAQQAELPRSWTNQPVEDLEQSGLAAAVRTQEGDVLARAHGHGDAVQGGLAPIVDVAHVLEFENVARIWRRRGHNSQPFATIAAAADTAAS